VQKPQKPSKKFSKVNKNAVEILLPHTSTKILVNLKHINRIYIWKILPEQKNGQMMNVLNKNALKNTTHYSTQTVYIYIYIYIYLNCKSQHEQEKLENIDGSICSLCLCCVNERNSARHRTINKHIFIKTYKFYAAKSKINYER